MRTQTLIVGAGPAGLQLGYFLQAAGHDHLIVERDSPGSFFKRFPRHRRLISINKVHTGYSDPEIKLRWDWNSLLSEDESLRFPRYTDAYFPAADDLVRYVEDFARRWDLPIRCGVDVVRVARDGETFVVSDAAGVTYRSDRLVVATGVSRPYLPEIPGIEHAEPYGEVSLDAAEFTDQRVLILGKGNSGFETAGNLVSTARVIHVASPRPLRLAWASRHVGHLRAINSDLIDTYLLKLQNVIIDGVCERIEERDGRLQATFRYARAKGERETLPYDRIIVCTGFRFDDSLFAADFRPALAIDDRFPAMTGAFESTNVSGLYFAGTLMQALDFKRKQSGFIHGFRYNVRALSHILELRDHGRPWPSRPVDAAPRAVAEAIVTRVNRSSALWQQTGFLCDVLVVPKRGGSARYYEEIPTSYLHEGEAVAANDYYAITLEFGDAIIAASPDPLALERVHKDDVESADRSTAIHPIIRRFVDGALVSEHHVIEDIESEWLEDVHVEPLVRYFERQLAGLARSPLHASAPA